MSYIYYCIYVRHIRNIYIYIYTYISNLLYKLNHIHMPHVAAQEVLTLLALLVQKYKFSAPFASVFVRQPHATMTLSRQHTSAYVSIRQHMSVYGSIRQHTAPRHHDIVARIVYCGLLIYIYIYILY